MRAAWCACAVLAACGFQPSASQAQRDGQLAIDGPPLDTGSGDAHRVDGAAVDASPIDAIAPPDVCAADPTLPLCLSFDATFSTTIPNEGSASDLVIAATNVTQVAGAASPSQAALLTTASVMELPPTTELPSIATMEMWLRVDADPVAPDFRDGLLDAATSASGLSLFFYLTGSEHQVRCVLGSGALFSTAVDFAPGSWHYAACTCDASTQVLTLYVDGDSVSQLTPCTPGAIDVSGLTIGQDNNGVGAATDDPFVGAIDAVRLWTIPRSAAQICADSGRSQCLN